jgi:omega-amidase
MGSLTISLGFDPGVLTHNRFFPALRNTDVLVFPELVDGGYAALAQGAAPHHADDLYVRAFRAASRKFSFCCIAGSVYLRTPPSSLTNTSFTFSHGRRIHRYDKMHLFGPSGDSGYFQPGRRMTTFTVRSGVLLLRAGVVLCYDLRFPELVRALALHGMRLLVVPARWPRKRDEAWRTLLRARAIENQIFVIGCNAPDSEGGFSYAFDPFGKLLFSNRGGRRWPLYSFSISPEALARARKHHDNLADAVLLKQRLRLRKH